MQSEINPLAYVSKERMARVKSALDTDKARKMVTVIDPAMLPVARGKPVDVSAAVENPLFRMGALKPHDVARFATVQSVSVSSVSR
jgi:hypothetical protein